MGVIAPSVLNKCIQSQVIDGNVKVNYSFQSGFISSFIHSDPGRGFNQNVEEFNYLKKHPEFWAAQGDRKTHLKYPTLII